jgi:hypothetical protein
LDATYSFLAYSAASSIWLVRRVSTIKTSTRLALSAGFITVTVIWLAVGLNLLPDATQSKLAGRAELVSAIAINTGILIDSQRERELQSFLDEICARSNEITSCGIRNPDGELKNAASDHARHWDRRNYDPTHQFVAPIMRDGLPQGQLEINFIPLHESGWDRALVYPLPLILRCGT